jgi:glycosyltransferase involved in cell wall biosynthesis
MNMGLANDRRQGTDASEFAGTAMDVNFKQMEHGLENSSYDIFIDWTLSDVRNEDLGFQIEQFKKESGFALTDDRFTVAMPEPRHAREQQVAYGAWWDAIARASARRRHLFVVIGKLIPRCDIVPPLLQALNADPMLATAQPRFSDSTTDRIWPLFGGTNALGQEFHLGRSALSMLPPLLITAELLAACFLLRRDVIADVGPPDRMLSSAAATCYTLCQVRRRGFRNIVANHVVVSTALTVNEIYPVLSEDDTKTLVETYPDWLRATGEYRKLPQLRLEPVLEAAFPNGGAERDLLLDCRGLVPFNNGTTQCILGLLGGLAGLRCDWNIDIVCHPDAAKYHRLEERFPRFRRYANHIRGYYAAIYKPDQPWSVTDLIDLHNHGYLIGFNILDTISWDCVYPSPRELDAVWRLTARHSDLLTYISAFSRDRFKARFQVSAGVRDEVIHLSLKASEQIDPAYSTMATGEHVLIFGNLYDHKAIGVTVGTLSTSLPDCQLIALGSDASNRSNLLVLPGGMASRDEVHRLLASAKAIVFPSFYEGFGLPVVEGLSYGRSVLVRRSPLWTEIASHAHLSGRLIEFDDNADLVDKLRQIVEGSNDTPTVPFGGSLAVGVEPPTWREVGEKLISLLEERLQSNDIRHWAARDEALSMIAQ